MFLKRWAAMACVVVAGLFAALPAWAQTRELVIAAWGDPYEAGWRKSLVPEFEKKHNVKVVWALAQLAGRHPRTPFYHG